MIDPEAVHIAVESEFADVTPPGEWMLTKAIIFLHFEMMLTSLLVSRKADNLPNPSLMSFDDYKALAEGTQRWVDMVFPKQLGIRVACLRRN